MRKLLFVLAVWGSLQSTGAQIHPVSQFILGDTTSVLTVTDFFVRPNGTVYSTGQRVKDSISLYISAVSPAGERIFELFRTKRFEEKGLFVRPYDSLHFIVCGYSEDATGTFNVRLLKLTYTGTVVWDTTYGDDGQGTMEMPNDLEVDSKGNIIIGGINQSSEIRYLLLKYSPEGKLLWSRRSVPFDTGQFAIHDLVLDAGNNIYGITNNTFITDTAHGTIIKWDPSGNELWKRNFNLAGYEERGNNLALSGDTLIAAGTPWFNGFNPISVAVVLLRTNGDLLSYRMIPLHSAQQGVRDLVPVFSNKIALITETHSIGIYRLHTIILSNALAILHRDSIASPAPLAGRVTAQTDVSFDVVRYGAHLSKVRYGNNNGSVSVIAKHELSLSGKAFELIDDAPPFLWVMNRIQGGLFDRVQMNLFSVAPLSVRKELRQIPSSPELFPPYPNPFNPSTTLSFYLPVRSFVSLAVYDLLGRRVSTVASEEMEAGTYSRHWNAAGLSSGVYLLRFQTPGTLRTASLLLLK